MALGVLTLAVFALLAVLLVGFTRTLYAGRPVDRFLVILGGYVGACISAAVAVTLAFWITRMVDAPIPVGLALTIIMLPVMTPFVIGFIAVYALLPAGLVIICAELAKIHSPFFYGPAGIAAAALGYALFDVSELISLPLLAVGGLAGGLTYWRIAGRSAGWVPT